jgi:IclR family mhp operon transcriptional activator
MPSREGGEETLRSLARGLTVVRALEREPGLSLQELHGRTRLPKPTLLRILATLEEMDFARKAGGVWQSSPGAWRLPHRDFRTLLVDVAGYEMRRLSGQLPWPADMHVHEQGMMQLVQSSRPETPFPLPQTPLGLRHHMLQSAAGRCWLAHCSPGERAVALRRLAGSSDPFDLAVREPGRVERIVREVRERGYAVRLPGYTPHHRKPARTMAISVPVHCQARLAASLTLVWDSSYAGVDAFAASHLPVLQKTAAAIGNRLTVLSEAYEIAPA